MEKPQGEGEFLRDLLLRRMDRRADRRIETDRQLIGLLHDGEEVLARCRDLSDRGARLDLRTPVGLNDRVEIAFMPGVLLPARVVWTNGSECGVAFDQPVDSAALLRAFAQGNGEPRSTQACANLPAIAEQREAARRGEVVRHGPPEMTLGHDGGFHAGLHITVLMKGGRECQAIVHWTDGSFAGLRLEDPFSVAQLRLPEPA